MQEEGAARAEGEGNQLINVIVPEHVHLVALGTEENFRERTGRAKIKEALQWTERLPWQDIPR